MAPSLAYADRDVAGTIVDDATGQPVARALISIGTAETTSDATGAFQLRNAPFGRLELIVVAEGYQSFFGAARAGGTLAIRLVADATGSEVIRVSGQRPSAPRHRLGTDDIRNLPGAGNDALRALQSMPGVARTPFGLGGLALRGTAPRDTKVYLDGIEVPLLYHFGGLASFLPTAAVDELALEPGGASVRYGRGLGGVAVLTSRTGHGDGWRAGGEVSLIHAAAMAEGPGPGKGSWLFGIRRSYFDAIEEAAGLDLALAPRYGDAQLRWESGDGRWMVIAFGADDSLRLLSAIDGGGTGGIDTSSIKDFEYASRFARLGLRYRMISGATQLTVVPSLGVDAVRARANHNGIDKGMERSMVPLNLRAELATPLAGGTLLVGADGGTAHHAFHIINTPPANPATGGDPQMVFERDLERWATDLGGFVEQSWFLAGGAIELRPGVRGDYFGLSEQWTLDPRLALHEYLPYGITLSQQVGRYHEPPLITDLDPAFQRPGPMPGAASTQLAIGAKLNFDDNELSATGYYQDLEQLPVDAVSGATPLSANGGQESGGLLAISRELVDTQFGSYTYREAIGSGHAYGVELIARRNTGRWTGWVSYTYGRSWRQNPVRGPGDVPYVLDQPHSFTALASTALGGSWRIGGRFRYTTGNPFTPVADVVLQDGRYRPIDGPLMSERLPAFLQLDLRVDHAWRRPWGTLNLYIDVQNVTNRDNPEGVTYSGDYSQRSYTTGLPVFPSIGLEYIP